MDQSANKFKSILGDQLFEHITTEDKTCEVRDDQDGQPSQTCLVNSIDIVCKCTTLILRPSHAKLILPTQPMLEIEKELKFYQQGDKLFGTIIRGCYWLVDDMYKFEQMGFTKEINSQNLIRQPQTSETNQNNPNESVGASENSLKNVDGLPQSNNGAASALTGLRYLACAECNLCPLGWFDPTTKESYLHVWPDKV